MLKIGYKASAEQFGPTQLLDFSVLAEEVGFDSVFVSDHFQPWKHTDGHAPNSLAWLGALGARTKRVVIGTSVATPTFRYHPSIVAQAFGTMGCMFPGRVVLGVGGGRGEHVRIGAEGQSLCVVHVHVQAEHLLPALRVEDFDRADGVQSLRHLLLHLLREMGRRPKPIEAAEHENHIQMSDPPERRGAEHHELAEDAHRLQFRILIEQRVRQERRILA